MRKPYRGQPLIKSSPGPKNAPAPHPPKSQVGKLNAKVPPAKPRGARFVRGFGEYSDK